MTIQPLLAEFQEAIERGKRLSPNSETRRLFLAIESIAGAFDHAIQLIRDLLGEIDNHSQIFEYETDKEIYGRAKKFIGEEL